jgi:hypothetical protein
MPAVTVMKSKIQVVKWGTPKKFKEKKIIGISINTDWSHKSPLVLIRLGSLNLAE